MNADEMLKRTLIAKHLEGWSGLYRLSIKSYMETGKISGSLFMAIKRLMSEYLKLCDRERSSEMKLPARIFVYYVKGEALETVGVFRTFGSNREPNAEYIHRNVVIKAMKQIEIDALDKACIKFNGFPKGLHESTEDEKNKILNKVIDKIEEKGVAK